MLKSLQKLESVCEVYFYASSGCPEVLRACSHILKTWENACNRAFESMRLCYETSEYMLKHPT